MSVLIVGMSHKSAPIELLERASLDTDAAVKLSHRALEASSVTEAAVISTCNRVEIYVEAERFHGAVEEVSRLLAEHADLDRSQLAQHVYVHYDDAAVAHVFAVAAGLDSMILGESQILGQVRDALHSAQAEATVGPALNALFQQALRIGKRGHAETGIDRLAPSIVTAGLAAAGPVAEAPTTRFLVAGAGTMASLAVRTLIDRGVDPERIAVANRTIQRAHELVATFGVRAVAWDDLDAVLADTDVVISCTGAAGVVFDRERVAAASAGRPLTLVDLALPRDVDPSAADLEGVTVIDLVVLGERAEHAELAADVEQVREIVEDEVRMFLAAKSASKRHAHRRRPPLDGHRGRRRRGRPHHHPDARPPHRGGRAGAPLPAARRRQAHPRAHRARAAARRGPGRPHLRRRPRRPVRARPGRRRGRHPRRG